jgi:hypothetical protein
MLAGVSLYSQAVLLWEFPELLEMAWHAWVTASEMAV